MADLNRVILAGNLTRDPDVRYTPSGKAVADVRMAVNRRYRTQDGETRDETCFVSIVVWGRQAETTGEYLRKGSPALVEGRLQYDEWERDGQKFNRLRVVAERVQFLGGPRGGAGGGSVDGAPASDPGPGIDRPSGPQKPEEPRAVNDTGDEDNLPF